jgi:flagellar L-ring protein precursor FlgH
MKTQCAYTFKRIAFAMITLVGLQASLGASSLWTNNGGRETGLAGDHKAKLVGDILTVVVQESASIQSSVRTATDSSSSIDAAVEQYLFSPSASNFGTHNGELPTIGMGGSTEYSGGGAITNKQSVSTRAAVTVIDVLPNGNLVIEGSRFVAYSGEKQYAILRGIVRPDDVSPTNTVLSSSIADARVEFLSEGSISSAQRKGWLTKIFDTINPF